MNYLIWNYSLFGRFIHWNCAFSFATPHNVLGFQLKISSHLVIIKCFMCFLNFNYKITVVHCSTTETLQIFIYVHKKRMLSYWLKLWPTVTRLLLRRDLVLGPPPPPLPLYDYRVITTTIFRPKSKKHWSLYYIEGPVNTTISLLRPWFYGQTVVTLTGSHCTWVSLTVPGWVSHQWYRLCLLVFPHSRAQCRPYSACFAEVIPLI